MSSNDEDDVDTALLLSTLSNVTIGQRNENEQHQKDYYAHHLRDAYDQAKANRPKTTSSAYEPKKKEYMKWCNEMFKTHPNVLWQDSVPKLKFGSTFASSISKC